MPGEFNDGEMYHGVSSYQRYSFEHMSQEHFKMGNTLLCIVIIYISYTLSVGLCENMKCSIHIQYGM